MEFAEFSKPRENGNFVEFRPQIVEITPEIGRLRTDLASGHLRKNSILLKFVLSFGKKWAFAHFFLHK